MILIAALAALAVPAAHALNTLGNPPHSVDTLVLLEGADELMRGATPDGVVKGPSGAVELAPGRATGSLILAPRTAPFPFNEMIPSWNGHAPAGAGFRVWMRATGPDATATPWFEAGTWGRVADEPTTRVARFAAGEYDIDHLLLRRPATTLETRLDLVRATPATPSPQFRMLALCFSNTTGDRDLARRHAPRGGLLARATGGAGKTAMVDVPFRSQVIDRKPWIGRICSPASVSMCTAHFGSPATTQELATMLYDPVSDMFGVWHRSIMGASEAGVRGYVRRFRNWNDVREELARGSVVCVSFRFRLGELKQPPRVYQRRGTEGHLVVLKGLTADGRAIVHDSASKDHGPDSVFLQEDLAKAWFDKGGVAYVFTGPAPRAR